MAKIYTDACLYKGTGGIGIYCETGEIKSVKAQKIRSGMTIQSLELEAIHRALSMVGLLKNVEVFTDSTYAFNSIVTHGHVNNQQGWLAVRDRHMHCHELLKMCYVTLLTYKRNNRNITLRYVKGHSGIHGNMQADELAGIAAGKIVQHTDVEGTLLASNEVALVTANSALVENKVGNTSLAQQGTGDQFSVESKMSTGSDDLDFLLNSTDEVLIKVGHSLKHPPAIEHTNTNVTVGASNTSGYVPDSPISYQSSITPENMEDVSGQQVSGTVVPRVMRVKGGNPSRSVSVTQDSPDVGFNDIHELYIACVQCAQMVVVKYPKGHPIASQSEINAVASMNFAITLCKECIMSRASPKSVSVATESMKYKERFADMRVSVSLIKGCGPHAAAERICETHVNILSTFGYVDFVPITTINRLCNRGTVSQTVSVKERELRTFLENGFL